MTKHIPPTEDQVNYVLQILKVQDLAELTQTDPIRIEATTDVYGEADPHIDLFQDYIWQIIADKKVVWTTQNLILAVVRLLQEFRLILSNKVETLSTAITRIQDQNE